MNKIKLRMKTHSCFFGTPFIDPSLLQCIHNTVKIEQPFFLSLLTKQNEINAKRWANAWHTQRKRENIANHACTEENLNILDFQKYLEKKLNGTCGVIDAIWKMSNWNLLGWIWQGFIETLTFSFCFFFIRLTKIPFCQNGTTQKIDILILSSLFSRFEFKV